MMKFDNRGIIAANQKYKIKTFKNYSIIFNNKLMKQLQNVWLQKKKQMFMIDCMREENLHQTLVENLYLKKRKKQVIINCRLKNFLLILKTLYKV